MLLRDLIRGEGRSAFLKSTALGFSGASLVVMTEDERGDVLDIDRKSRTIPPSMARALRTRDQGCRFPGCTNRCFVDGHHIKHWSAGGETKLDNLVQLCRTHHRLIHEGGFSVERASERTSLQTRGWRSHRDRS